jgi:hypothetical protein
MYFLMNNWRFILFSFVFLGCVNKTDSQEKLKELFSFPKELKEVSGLIFYQNLIWTIQDQGNQNEVFALNEKGQIQHRFFLKNAQNVDWEAITKDENGFLYIGDFGNNDNSRKDLTIYQFDPLNQKTPAEKITFYYPEQVDFPPKKSEKLFDCEAFFLHEGDFYLFTKNRSKNFDGTILVYKIPNQKGHHQAELLGSFKTCDSYQSCVITDVAISPNGKTIAILGHDSIWLIENFDKDSFLSQPIVEYALGHFSQKEGICFKDDEILFVADERSKRKGGKLYEISITALKNSH